MTRRRWLRRLLGYGTLAGLGLYTWRCEPHWVELVERQLPIRNLSGSLEGKTVVQLSDLHIGMRVSKQHIHHSLSSVNQLKPDLVVLTGDFITYESDEQFDQLSEALHQLQIPALGCYAVLGNHDYGQAWNNVWIADQVTMRLTSLGIRVLRNEVHTVHGLQLAGIDDLWSPCYSAVKVLNSIQRDQAVLALCHNPDAQDLNEWQSYQGWVLAGHTHGGQCKPPFLPPPLLPVKNRRYTSGYFDLGHARKMYINRGLGYLMRVRFNARPEITRFRLTADTSIQERPL